MIISIDISKLIIDDDVWKFPSMTMISELARDR